MDVFEGSRFMDSRLVEEDKKPQGGKHDFEGDINNTDLGSVIHDPLRTPEILKQKTAKKYMYSSPKGKPKVVGRYGSPEGRERTEEWVI